MHGPEQLLWTNFFSFYVYSSIGCCRPNQSIDEFSTTQEARFKKSQIAITCCNSFLASEKIDLSIEIRSILIHLLTTHKVWGSVNGEAKRRDAPPSHQQTTFRHISNPNCSLQEKEKVIFYAREQPTGEGKGRCRCKK
jgi:hypothetical protein